LGNTEELDKNFNALLSRAKWQNLYWFFETMQYNIIATLFFLSNVTTIGKNVLSLNLLNINSYLIQTNKKKSQIFILMYEYIFSH